MALVHVTAKSDVLQMKMPLDVILPEKTRGQIGMEGRADKNKYPVLYLLHGMSDDHTIWQRRTSIERYAAEKGLAVVMPTTHLGWYTDMHMGAKYFTYISDELVRTCRDFFPRMSTRREDTFVAGLSMGGYGALKCGLRASDTFGACASLSGAVDIVSTMAQVSREDTFWTDIFGPKDAVRASFNDLFAAAEALAASSRPRVYLWCGTEDFLYTQNVAMREHLTRLGYDLTYEESPGDHQWKYWDQKIQTVLDWLSPDKEAT